MDSITYNRIDRLVELLNTRLVLVLQHLNNRHVVWLQRVIELLLKNYLVKSLSSKAVLQQLHRRMVFNTCALRHETQPTVHHTGGQNVDCGGLLRRQNCCTLDHIQNFWNCVGAFDFQGDDVACQGLHLDLHGTTQLEMEQRLNDDAT